MLTQLNLRDLFPVVVDVNAVTPYCKPMPEAFKIAMKLAGESDPSRKGMARQATKRHVQHFIRRDSRKRRCKRESFRLE